MSNDKQNEPANRRGAADTALRLAIFVCFVVQAVGALSGDEQAVEYETSGEIVWSNEARSADGTKEEMVERESRFIVSVSGGQWYIGLIPSNWPARYSLGAKVPALLSYEVSSDGRNVYQVSRYDPKDLPPPASTQVAERWAGSMPMDRGSHRELHALWYAFASSAYCRSVSSGPMMGLEPRSKSVYGRIETNRRHPGLPATIVVTNVETGISSRLSVSQFTNVWGLSLPAEGVVEYGLSDLAAGPWGLLKFKVLTVQSKPSRSAFRLDLNNARALIYDSSFRQAKPPYTDRIVSNNWPRPGEVQTRYDKRKLSGQTLNAAEKERAADKNRASTSLSRYVVLMLLGITTVLLVFQLNKKSKTPPNKL